MTAPALDDFLLRLAPAPPIGIAEELISARASIRSALAALSAVPDSALEQEWQWDGSELDVRYGFYRQYEQLENRRALIGRLVANEVERAGPARPLVAAATAARWELHGLLAGLADGDLDLDPGNGEWTLRQTLAHIVSGQRGYAWFTAWWLGQRDSPLNDFPKRPPEDADIGFPDEETEGRGTLADIQRRFDDIVDLSAGVFAPFGEKELTARARWSGKLVDVRFRIVRWSSHIREHTIQIEKTLGFVGHATSEVDRLLRLIAGAYGRLEETLFMLPADHPNVADALKMAESTAVRVSTSALSVASETGAP
jgi:hypothetical protein